MSGSHYLQTLSLKKSFLNLLLSRFCQDIGKVADRLPSSRTGDRKEGSSFEGKTERKGRGKPSLKQTPAELSLGAGGPVQVQVQLIGRGTAV